MIEVEANSPSDSGCAGRGPRRSFSVNVGEIVELPRAQWRRQDDDSVLTGFATAHGGSSARVAGFDIVSQSMEVRSRIGYLPETVPLYHAT